MIMIRVGGASDAPYLADVLLDGDGQRRERLLAERAGDALLLLLLARVSSASALAAGACSTEHRSSHASAKAREQVECTCVRRGDGPIGAERTTTTWNAARQSERGRRERDGGEREEGQKLLRGARGHAPGGARFDTKASEEQVLCVCGSTRVVVSSPIMTAKTCQTR